MLKRNKLATGGCPTSSPSPSQDTIQPLAKNMEKPLLESVHSAVSKVLYLTTEVFVTQQKIVVFDLYVLRGEIIWNPLFMEFIE